MYLCVSAVRSMPQLGVTHGAKEVGDLLSFVLGVSLDFKAVDLLQNLRFLVQQLL